MKGLCFTSDALKLASCSYDSAIRIYDLQTSKEIALLEGHQGPVNSMCFNRDEGKLVSCGDDKTVRIWDLESNLEEVCLKGHQGVVH